MRSQLVNLMMGKDYLYNPLEAPIYSQSKKGSVVGYYPRFCISGALFDIALHSGQQAHQVSLPFHRRRLVLSPSVRS